MRREEELKRQLNKILEKYPLINEFFGRQISNRVNQEGWLENRLIQTLLLEGGHSNDREYLNSISSILKEIKKDEKNFYRLSNKQSGKGDYNQQIKDLLAEINAYTYLKRDGYKDIEVIEPKSQKHSSPDFRANKNGEQYLFEVENMRSPYTLLDPLTDKLKAKYLQEPYLYNKMFYLNLLAHEEDNNKLGIEDINRLATQIFEEICKEIKALKESKFSLQHRYGNKSLLDCEISGSSLSFMYSLRNERIVCIDEKYKGKRKDALKRKMLRKIAEASRQLLGYPEQKQYKKVILLNWERPCCWGSTKEEYKKEYLEDIIIDQSIIVFPLPEYIPL